MIEVSCLVSEEHRHRVKSSVCPSQVLSGRKGAEKRGGPGGTWTGDRLSSRHVNCVLGVRALHPLAVKMQCPHRLDHILSFLFQPWSGRVNHLTTCYLQSYPVVVSPSLLLCSACFDIMLLTASFNTTLLDKEAECMVRG